MRSPAAWSTSTPPTSSSQVEVEDQFLYRHEHLIMGLTFALSKSVRADRGLKDADLIAALTSLAKTWETLVNSGLHYENPIASPAQQSVATEVQNMIKEYREAEQKHVGYVQLRDSEVLRALVFMVRMAHARTSGRPKSRAFADFLLGQFPEKPSGIAGAEEAQPDRGAIGGRRTSDVSPSDSCLRNRSWEGRDPGRAASSLQMHRALAPGVRRSQPYQNFFKTGRGPHLAIDFGFQRAEWDNRSGVHDFQNRSFSQTSVRR